MAYISLSMRWGISARGRRMTSMSSCSSSCCFPTRVDILSPGRCGNGCFVWPDWEAHFQGGTSQRPDTRSLHTVLSWRPIQVCPALPQDRRVFPVSNPDAVAVLPDEDDLILGCKRYDIDPCRGLKDVDNHIPGRYGANAPCLFGN